MLSSSQSSSGSMGCGASSGVQPVIMEPAREVSSLGRRKSYNTGGNLFPKSARNKVREKDEEISKVLDDIYFTTHGIIMS